MAKQALVIGLGRFGISVARALMERNVEVLAADQRSDRVRAAVEYVTDSVCMDATDSEALSQTAPDRRDICICAFGDDSIQASILCTALLREMGAKRVIARASDNLQARILRRVGAHEVIDPLRDFGRRFASHLVHDDILGEMPLGRDLVITEMRPTEALIGKSLAELNLQGAYGITVVGWRHGSDVVESPDPRRPLEDVDALIVVSRPDAVSRLMEGNAK
jgi:trk system potassium uptake protein TrkA